MIETPREVPTYTNEIEIGMLGIQDFQDLNQPWAHETQKGGGEMIAYANDVAILIELHFRKCKQLESKQDKEKYKFARVSYTSVVDVIEMKQISLVSSQKDVKI